MSEKQKQIEQNIVCCENILDILAVLDDSDANVPDTWLLLHEITNETMQLKIKMAKLKELYSQIIP